MEDWQCCNGNCCDKNNCESCKDNQCEYCDGDYTKSCCDGQCYDPQTQGCCDDLTIYDPNTKKCCNDGLGHTCEKSPVNKTCCYGDCCDTTKSQVSYSTGLSDVASGIESGINSIPNVTASGWSVSASFTAEKGEDCCEEHPCTDYYQVSGNVDMSGSVSVSVPGLGWSWDKEWLPYGSIKASLGITITPEITVDSASVGASGKDSACGSCLTLTGSGSGTGTITCTAGGDVKVHAFPDSEWLNYSLIVNVSASAQASVSAGASGTYKTGGGCIPPTGFCLTNYWASDAVATGTITFQIGPLGPYSATSDPVTLVEGCNVNPGC